MDELKAIGDLRAVRASWAMLVSDELFAQENHIHLERSRQRMHLLMTLPAQGKRPHHSTREGERLYSDESRSRLRKSLRDSFFLACLAAACAVGAGMAIGDVRPSLPWHLGKVLQTSGGGLALWGTLFALNGLEGTRSGGSVPERVHASVFTSLLAAGGCLATLGTLILPGLGAGDA